MNTLYRCEKCGREFWTFNRGETCPCLFCGGMARRIPYQLIISWVAA
jgi:DNA-directed RNA polymerase subunit RPC12/RpoP